MLPRKKERETTLFFETSAILISFVLLGKFLEIVAKGKASNAVSESRDFPCFPLKLVTREPAVRFFPFTGGQATDRLARTAVCVQALTFDATFHCLDAVE